VRPSCPPGAALQRACRAQELGRLQWPPACRAIRTASSTALGGLPPRACTSEIGRGSRHSQSMATTAGTVWQMSCPSAAGLAVRALERRTASNAASHSFSEAAESTRTTEMLAGICRARGATLGLWAVLARSEHGRGDGGSLSCAAALRSASCCCSCMESAAYSSACAHLKQAYAYARIQSRECPGATYARTHATHEEHARTCLAQPYEAARHAPSKPPSGCSTSGPNPRNGRV
jgi:hypothetical protein